MNKTLQLIWSSVRGTGRRGLVPGLGNLPAAAAAAFCLLFLVAVSADKKPSPRPEPTARAGKRSVTGRLAALPLSFEVNQGQSDGPARFLARGAGYLLYLTDSEAVLGLHRPDQGSKAKKQESATAGSPPQVTAVVHMRLAGSNSAPRVTGVDQLPGKANYFIGADPKKWRTNIPTYAKVRYENVYPGVDLIYYGHQGRLEDDFVVAPGSDPQTVALEFKGARAVSVASSGDLVLSLSGGEVRLEKPRAYQRAGAAEATIPARFVSRGRSRVGFAVGPYDSSRPLVIDPVLSYSTYLGGANSDQATGIAVDSFGFVYVSGSTLSSDFPTKGGIPPNTFNTTACFLGTRPCFDAFVTKFDPTGSTLVYSTYLGGSGDDTAAAIAVGGTPTSAFVVGRTTSTDFPTVNPVLGHNTKLGTSDAFVAHLDPTGASLLYSTYLGGTGDDRAFGVAFDSAGDAYVTGSTSSTDFPTTALAFQTTLKGTTNAFVTKLSTTTGSVAPLYSTYLGGSGSDVGFGIALDSSVTPSSPSACVTGSAGSTDFPTASPLQGTAGGGGDAFVAKVNVNAVGLFYSTYLGGSGADQGNAIAVDAAGNAYVTGSTASADFPVAGPLQAANGGGNDAFVAKVKPDGSALVYSTYLGGKNSDAGFAITLDSSGDAYVTGQTGSSDFPMVNAIESTLAGANDAFVAELNPQGNALLFSSFLGGSNGNDLGAAIAVDSGLNIYLAGNANSTDFPTLAGSFAAAPPSGTNAFVAKIASADGSAVSLSKASLTFPDESVGATSGPMSVTLRNMGSAPLSVASVATCASTNPCVPSSDFGDTDNCLPSVAGGGSCVLSVTFSPSGRGARTGSLSITDSASGSPRTISLSGNGITPAVTLSASSLTFGSQNMGTTSAPQSVTLTNTGTDPLTISGVTLGGDFAETNTCLTTLSPGSSCSASVTFTPTAPLSRTGLLVFSDNGPGSPQFVQLSGTGVGPTATLSTGGLSFTEQPVGTTSGPQTFTITNNGNAPLLITGVSQNGGFAQTNNCGGSLPVGTPGAPSSCTFTVTYSPTAAGTTFGSVTISDNARGSPQIVNLSGTAVAGLAPEAFLSPSSLVVTSQPVSTSSAVQPVTLTNTGNAALVITSIVASGDFVQTNSCGSLIAAGKNCAINVTFTPIQPGTRTGSLTVTDNATGSPHSATLAGIGIDFGVTASSAGSIVTAGQSATFNVTVIPVAGYNQGVTFSCGKLPPNTTCTFAPATVTLDGTNSATVKLTLATTKNSVSAPRIILPPPAWPLGLVPILVLLALTLLAAALYERRRAVRRAALAAGVFLALLGGACVINSPKPTGTVPGTYTFTVTATATAGSGALSHTINLGLTVN